MLDVASVSYVSTSVASPYNTHKAMVLVDYRRAALSTHDIALQLEHAVHHVLLTAVKAIGHARLQLPNASNVKTALDELVPKSHSHANKDTLDKFSVSNGELQYNGSNVVPTALKNPNALTIKIGSSTVTYDGSTTQTVTIDDGTEVKY